MESNKLHTLMKRCRLIGLLLDFSKNKKVISDFLLIKIQFRKQKNIKYKNVRRSRASPDQESNRREIPINEQRI